jgi:hypothetical protein
VIRAVRARDWAVLSQVLHPYLHWTSGGATIRGRRNVLARLAEHPAVTEPAAAELRDGQVYRWTENFSQDKQARTR